MKTFLCYVGETLEDAKPFGSKSSAVADFENTALKLARYGQAIEASLHVAEGAESLAKYPDFVLSLGPRGGVRCERTGCAEVEFPSTMAVSCRRQVKGRVQGLPNLCSYIRNIDRLNWQSRFLARRQGQLLG